MRIVGNEAGGPAWYQNTIQRVADIDFGSGGFVHVLYFNSVEGERWYQCPRDVVKIAVPVSPVIPSKLNNFWEFIQK